MAIQTALKLRSGHVIEFEGDICEVKSYEFVTQGRGGSTVKLVLRNLRSGAQKFLSINSDVKFNVVEVEEEEFEYMYDDGDSIFTTSGEVFPISKVENEIIELIPQAGMIRIVKFNNEIYKILLPKKAKVKIKGTEPAFKGQAAASSYKPATLYNGWIIQVPAFFEEEDEVIIDTTDLNNPIYHSKPS